MVCVYWQSYNWDNDCGLQDEKQKQLQTQLRPRSNYATGNLKARTRKESKKTLKKTSRRDYMLNKKPWQTKKEPKDTRRIRQK